jgi:Ca-activated chloride channel family protein
VRLRSLSPQLLRIVIVCSAALSCMAQTPPVAPPPQPTPPIVETQEQVKVFTEEVLVPVSVFDRNGRFDPTLVADDLLLFEDGILQPITSLRRVPSSVLLLLDTGGALNPAMSTNTTREIAIHLVSNLRAGDQMAALQFGNRVEMIQNWTTEKDQTIGALKTKLSSGRHGYLTHALMAAATQLKAVPSGSRHVVLITDGVEAAGDRARLTEALTQLLTAHVTVHVISYTSIGRKAMGPRNPLVRVTMEKPKSASDVANELMHPEAIPESQRRRKVYVVLDTDFPMRNRNKKYEEATKESELWLTSLADETGGLMLLPTTTNEMIMQGELVAREIDSQYVLAYTPKRSLTSAADGEYRSIKVVSLRGGPEVRSRRGYVAKPPRGN